MAKAAAASEVAFARTRAHGPEGADQDSSLLLFLPRVSLLKPLVIPALVFSESHGFSCLSRLTDRTVRPSDQPGRHGFSKRALFRSVRCVLVLLLQLLNRFLRERERKKGRSGGDAGGGGGGLFCLGGRVCDSWRV